MSETASCKPYLQRFCVGQGLDLGCGDEKIRDDAIGVDIKVVTECDVIHDASNLGIFGDDSMDYVYSSHLLEDFVNTEAVLREWIRIIKPNGNLVLFLPNQMAYEEHCAKNSVQPNQDHKHKHFCFEYVVACLPACMNVIHFENPVTYNPYSFSLVCRKLAGMPTHTLNDIVRAKAREAKVSEINQAIAEAQTPKIWTPNDIP